MGFRSVFLREKARSILSRNAYRDLRSMTFSSHFIQWVWFRIIAENQRGRTRSRAIEISRSCQSEIMGIAIEVAGERFVGAPRMDFAENL